MGIFQLAHLNSDPNHENRLKNKSLAPQTPFQKIVLNKQKNI